MMIPSGMSNTKVDERHLLKALDDLLKNISKEQNKNEQRNMK